MATNKTNTPEVTREEYIAAENAFTEYRFKGKTEKRCIRCGGEYIFEEKNHSYRIKCAECAFVITSRGL